MISASDVHTFYMTLMLIVFWRCYRLQLRSFLVVTCWPISFPSLVMFSQFL